MGDLTLLNEEEKPLLALFDKENPRALINILWPDFVYQIESHRQFSPQWFDLDEKMIERKLRELDSPMRLLAQLRVNFWMEYNDSQDRSKKMCLANVLHGTCSSHIWKKHVEEIGAHVAYILLPPSDYVVATRAAHYMALKEMMDLLDEPNFDLRTRVDGRSKVKSTYKIYNSKVIDAKIRIFSMLDQRVKGAIVQKLAVQSQTHITTDPLHGMSLDDLQILDRQIESVTSKMKQLEDGSASPSDILDVTVEAQTEVQAEEQIANQTTEKPNVQ